MLFTDFPKEIIVCVLGGIAASDLFTFRQVSRLLRSVVDDNARLRYKLELAIAGMEDNPSDKRNSIDKLTMLRDHQAALRAFSMDSQSTTVIVDRELKSELRWELNGQLFFVPENGEIRFRVIPLKSRGIIQRSWSVNLKPPAEGDEYLQVLVNSSQDVICIFIEPNLVLGEHLYIALFISMTTGAPIDSDSEGRVEIENTSRDNGGVFTERQNQAQLCGNLFAFLQYQNDYNMILSSLLILDWRTGETVRTVRPADLGETFAFLDDRHIVTAGKCSRGVQLYIFDVLRRDGDPSVPEVTLTLPGLNKDARVTFGTVNILSDPPPPISTTLSVQDSYPFQVYRGEHIIQFHLNVYQHAYRGEVGSEVLCTNFRFFIPSSILKSLLPDSPKERGRVIPWDEWGLQGTRAFRFEYNDVLGEVQPSISTYGSMVAISQDGVIVLYDFNPLAVRYAAGSKEVTDNCQVITDTTVIDVRELVHPMKTSLPYVKYTTAVPVADYQCITIGESCIILSDLRDNSDGILIVSI